MMLTDYHGKRFEKVGAIFIVTPEKYWKDSHFIDISKLIMLNLYGAGRLLSRTPKN